MIDPADYRELRVRSAFSFLRGAASPRLSPTGSAGSACPRRRSATGTDFMVRSGSTRGRRRTVSGPIVGTELTMEDGSVLPLLVKSREGYRSVSRLLTRAQLRAPKGGCAVAWSELESIAGGVVFSHRRRGGAARAGLARGGPRGMEEAMANTCSGTSPNGISMSNCSVTPCAARKRWCGPRPISRRDTGCPCSPPAGRPMPSGRTVSCTMSSPACASTPRSTRRDASSR